MQCLFGKDGLRGDALLRRRTGRRRHRDDQTPLPRRDEFDPVRGAVKENLGHAAFDHERAGPPACARGNKLDLLGTEAGGTCDADPILHQRGLDDVRAADEIRDESGAGSLVDFLRLADLLDPPMVEDGDPVGHRQGFTLVVRDEDEGEAKRVLQGLKFALHRLAQLQVEGPERLVE